MTDETLEREGDKRGDGEHAEIIAAQQEGADPEHGAVGECR